MSLRTENQQPKYQILHRQAIDTIIEFNVF